MTAAQLLSPALRSLLPQFIAEAVARAELPPLTQPGDHLFLRGVMESVIDAFWEAYASQLSDLAREKLAEAEEDETGERIVQWLAEFANFERDEGARLLAQDIMADFKEKFPSLIREEYQIYASRAAT